MKELTTKLTGIIASVETKQTKKNTDWHTINVEIGDKTYTVKSFGKSAVDFTESHAGQGDRVELHCSVEASEWNGKWFINLGLISIRIVESRTMQVPEDEETEQPPSGGASDNQPVDETEDLPF